MRFAQLAVLAALISPLAAPAAATGDAAECLAAKDGGPPSFYSDSSIEPCTRAIDSGEHRGPALAELYSKRGHMHYMRREYARAADDYDRVFEADPKYKDYLLVYTRGLSRERAGQPELAIRDLQLYLQLYDQQSHPGMMDTTYAGRARSLLKKLGAAEKPRTGCDAMLRTVSTASGTIETMRKDPDPLAVLDGREYEIHFRDAKTNCAMMVFGNRLDACRLGGRITANGVVFRVRDRYEVRRDFGDDAKLVRCD